MPQSNRASIGNAAIGFGVAGVFVAGLIGMNVAGVGQMVLASGMGVVAAVALWLLHGVAFTAIQIAFKSMGLDDDDSHHGGPRGGKLIPIRVEAHAKSRRR